MREMLIPVVREGRCIYDSPSVMEIQAYCKKEQNLLWDETRRLVNPNKAYVDLSPGLFAVKNQLLMSYKEKIVDAGVIL